MAAGIRNERLPGGLELVFYPTPGTRFVDIVLAVPVGSRHDPPSLRGLSHFAEHMIFRGCKLLPSGPLLNLEFERLGEGLNALSHKEYTAFTTRVPAQSLEQTLKYLASVVNDPLFDEIETERGIVLEEILEELDENGREADIENISRRAIFGAHPLAYPVLGRAPTVKRIRENDLRVFHQMHYLPSRMVLSVAGGCSWEKTVAAANAAFAAFGDTPNRGEAASGSRAVGGGADIVQGPPKPRAGVRFVDENGSQVQAIVSFFMPGEQSPGELARLFLCRVLDDGISSRLQRTVCERRGLLYDISCELESMADVALFDVQFNVSAAKLCEVLELVLGELKRLREELVAPEEFSMVKGRFTRDVQATAESSRAMAALLAEAFVLRLPFPIEPNEYEARIRELTPEAVRAEARNGFRAARAVFVSKGRVPAMVQKRVRKILKSLG